jgi:hypothetical protein
MKKKLFERIFPKAPGQADDVLAEPIEREDLWIDDSENILDLSEVNLNLNPAPIRVQVPDGHHKRATIVRKKDGG